MVQPNLPNDIKIFSRIAYGPLDVLQTSSHKKKKDMEQWWSSVQEKLCAISKNYDWVSEGNCYPRRHTSKINYHNGKFSKQ